VGHAVWDLDKTLDTSQTLRKGDQTQVSDELVRLLLGSVLEREGDDTAEWNTDSLDVLERVARGRRSRLEGERPSQELQLSAGVWREQLLDVVEGGAGSQSRVTNDVDLGLLGEPVGDSQGTKSMSESSDTEGLQTSNHQVTVPRRGDTSMGVLHESKSLNEVRSDRSGVGSNGQRTKDNVRVTARVLGEGRKDNVSDGGQTRSLADQGGEVEGGKEGRVDDDQGSSLLRQRVDDLRDQGQGGNNQKGVGGNFEPNKLSSAHALRDYSAFQSSPLTLVSGRMAARISCSPAFSKSK
jgi:hypothetical protein